MSENEKQDAGWWGITVRQTGEPVDEYGYHPNEYYALAQRLFQTVIDGMQRKKSAFGITCEMERILRAEPDAPGREKEGRNE